MCATFYYTQNIIQSAKTNAGGIDVSNPECVENLVDQSAKALEGLDILVNNAGTSYNFFVSIFYYFTS